MHDELQAIRYIESLVHVFVMNSKSAAEKDNSIIKSLSDVCCQ